MSDKYDWPKIYKAEENLEQQINESVFDHICWFFDVEDVSELTEEQYEEVVAFREELNEYSPMQWGFSNFIQYWENESPNSEWNSA
jgi:hypothetical protein